MFNNNKLEAHEKSTTDHKLLPFQRHNNEAITDLVSFPGAVIVYSDKSNLMDKRLIYLKVYSKVQHSRKGRAAGT